MMVLVKSETILIKINSVSLANLRYKSENRRESQRGKKNGSPQPSLINYKVGLG